MHWRRRTLRKLYNPAISQRPLYNIFIVIIHLHHTKNVSPYNHFLRHLRPHRRHLKRCQARSLWTNVVAQRCLPTFNLPQRANSNGSCTTCGVENSKRANYEPDRPGSLPQRRRKERRASHVFASPSQHQRSTMNQHRKEMAAARRREQSTQADTASEAGGISLLRSPSQAHSYPWSPSEFGGSEYQDALSHHDGDISYPHYRWTEEETYSGHVWENGTFEVRLNNDT